MTEQITLSAPIPVVVAGQDTAQLAAADAVPTWNEDAAEYQPQVPLERLITHDTTGSGDYEIVCHTDGSVVWH